jgi:hypothetical protein
LGEHTFTLTSVSKHGMVFIVFNMVIQDRCNLGILVSK